MKLISTALAFVLVGFAGVTARADEITGAGATFPAPVYSAWGEAAKAGAGITLNYQAIGSGGGQNQILNRTVDFGASDAPMAPEKLESGKLLQFPTVIGAVVPIINLPGIKPNELKLTGDALAAIYLGKIVKWNDEKIAELNPGVKLPSTAIAPVYRADGSGTTYVFTSYLSAVDPEWKDKVGAATSVKWLAGNGAKGNDGVAALVQQVKGGVGYVEYAYAAKNGLTTTQLSNHDGKFVTPTPASFAAGAANGDWKNAKNYAVSLINLPGAESWPIMSTTFIELPKDPKDPARSLAVMKFFDWAYTNGAKQATDLNYIPLPAAVANAVRESWKTEIKGPDGAPAWK
jgi:phosphate transport system substrate-binding protein